MKKILLFSVLMIFAISIFGQTNYSGLYSYSFKPKGNPPDTEKDKGPSGQLALLKMNGNQYRFWLDVTLGWPNYNVGETDGTITFVNDTASFDNTFEDADLPCILKFKIADNTITINSQSTSFNCGFGNAVHADGEYKRDIVQPKFDNAWLQKEYYSSPTISLKNKVQLYKDENCFYPKSEFFVKGTAILNITENEKNMYTEYITTDGKFMYGWIKKTDIK